MTFDGSSEKLQSEMIQ